MKKPKPKEGEVWTVQGKKCVVEAVLAGRAVFREIRPMGGPQPVWPVLLKDVASDKNITRET
jgi:hypothetical protein